jgi:3-oxoacyl-[acyl-carrier protein] reductase
MLTIDLTGRRALVTGGARGIGAAIVRALAECGADVCFTHRGSPEGTEAAGKMVAELTAQGRTVHSYVAAAQDPAAMDRVTALAAEQRGGLDLLVPNVGANEPRPLENLDLAAWQRALDLNLTSAYVAIKSALPWLSQAERADIVLIGSSASLDGGGGSAAYAAAKAGLEGLMFALMRELPARGIHVNTVSPCLVDTDLLRQRYDTEEKRARLAAQVPLGRLSRPEDVAYLVAYLCSDLGGFLCGQTILVDGGRTLWRNH